MLRPTDPSHLHLLLSPIHLTQRYLVSILNFRFILIVGKAVADAVRKIWSTT